MTKSVLLVSGFAFTAMIAVPVLSQTGRIDPTHFPAAMHGKWGTSAANCSGADDYGPLHVNSDGFSHYEVSSESITIRLLKGRTYQLSYAVRDIASEDLDIRKEVWTLSPDNNTLIIDYPDGQDREIYSRCELLK